MSNASHFGPPGVVTPTEGRHFQLLKQAIQEHWRHNDVVSFARDGWPLLPCSCAPALHHHSAAARAAMRLVWPQPVPVAPFLLSGGTDSKHFAGLSPNGILRFVPYAVTKGEGGELETVHARDERVKVTDYANAICTYERVLELFSAA